MMICFPVLNDDLKLFLKDDRESTGRSYNRTQRLRRLIQNLNESPQNFGFLSGEVCLRRVRLGDGSGELLYVDVMEVEEF